MSSVHLLDELTANQIAAGEVIERPVSVVKELVENSIDAGAKNITVEITNGGLSFVRVSDDGSGMSKEDACLAVKRHATSKLKHLSDLNYISTLGFRGEALPSILSVAKVELDTREQQMQAGTRLYHEGNNLLKIEPVGTPVGTSIKVEDLFFNTPARKKFLRQSGYEAGLIHEIMNQFSLGHPEINFTLSNDGKELLNTKGIDTIPDLLQLFFGKNIRDYLTKIEGNISQSSVSGYFTLPGYNRSNRKGIHFFVNKRRVLSKELSSALEEAFRESLPKGRFPVAVIHLNIPPSLLDVNIHPSKREIKIRDSQVFADFIKLVRENFNTPLSVPTYITKPILTSPEKKSEDTALPFVQEKWNTFYNGQASVQLNKSFLQQAIPLQDKQYTLDKSVNQENSDLLHDSELQDKQKIADRDNSLPYLKYIGQLFNTFILAEGEKGLYILDQHVVHERIIFEYLMHRWETGEIESQSLLVPITLELTPLEEELVIEHILQLQEMGIILEHFGPRSYLLRTIPSSINDDPQDFFFALLEDIESKGRHISSADFKKQVLITASCKSAVKAKQYLSHDECSQLLEDLRKTKNPLTCPHGRPIVYHIPYKDILKAFHR